MGGRNHQPTNTRMVAASALLSKNLGVGFAQCIAANNALEDAIIIGFDRLHVEELTSNITGSVTDHIQSAIQCLEASLETVGHIRQGFENLQKIAILEGYKGNPLAAQIESYDLSDVFSESLVRPTVNMSIWKEVESRIAKHNIMATLAWESDEFLRLVEPTRTLICTIRSCLGIAKNEGGGVFVASVENNIVPLRQNYSIVFSLWNYLDNMFLYSSLMMTELFYRANGFSSLTDSNPRDHHAAKGA